MDFDKPKVYGDTSITDGFVLHRVVNAKAVECFSALSLFWALAHMLFSMGAYNCHNILLINILVSILIIT